MSEGFWNFPGCGIVFDMMTDHGNDYHDNNSNNNRSILDSQWHQYKQRQQYSVSTMTMASTMTTTSTTTTVRSLNKNDNKAFPVSMALPLPEEVASMSFQEREEAYNQVHCVPDRIIEDPEEIQNGLAELDHFIQKLKDTTNAGKSYRLAETQNKAYVQDVTLRLKFLRAEKYKPQDAASRMFRYFDEKLRLFGEEKLTQEILFQDLSDEDRIALESGVLQQCPVKDRAGRKHVVIIPSQNSYSKPENILRAHFYNFMSMSEEESSQINGIGMFLYKLNRRQTRTSVFWGVLSLIRSIPLRACVGHACFSDNRMTGLYRMFSQTVDKVSRLSTVVHCGTHVECMYSLMSYGMPVYALPFQDNNNGTISLQNHMEWIATRKVLDLEKMRKRLQSNNARCNTVASSMTSSESGSEAESHGVIVRNNDFDLLYIDFASEKHNEDIDMLMKEEISVLENDEIFDGNMQENRMVSLDHVENEETKEPEMVHLPVTTHTNYQSSHKISSCSDSKVVIVKGKNTFTNPTESSIRTTATHANTNTNSATTTTTKVTNADVLLGKGKPLLSHPGNVTFREIISSRMDKYDKATKSEKTKIADEIVHIIKSSHCGRFLKPSDDHKGPLSSPYNIIPWEEIDDTAARLKVAFTFRSFRKNLRKAQQ